ncbi:MAG: hypothetical protein R3F37_11115 [Candidatus Competibacteraceae bacterium]
MPRWAWKPRSGDAPTNYPAVSNTVAIARALIGDPTLIIADEPTANLDTENARAIIAIMRERNRQQGTTFLFSTHDARLLDQVDRKIHLRDGQ